MEQVLSSMTGLEKLFLTCALFGGTLFVIRIVMQFIGGFGDVDTEIDAGGVEADFDIDADVGVDVDIDAEAQIDAGEGEAAIEDSTASFRLLTLQGITGFFMMFGLVGLALLRQTRLSEGWAIFGAVLWGLFTLWIVAKLFQFMRNLQSSGTIDIRNAVGEEGTVYLTIPADGTGKAQVTIQDRLRVMDAVCQQGEEIKTGESIRVVRVVGDSTLVVEKSER